MNHQIHQQHQSRSLFLRSVSACLQGLRANALALREQFLASQAETRALREELAAARTKMESAERMSADLQE